MDSQLEHDDFDDDQHDDLREGENDIEYIIMNLYSKMKNLEGKYIDLANFYKQELVRSSVARTSTDFDNNLSQGMNPLRQPMAGGMNYGLASPSRERNFEID